MISYIIDQHSNMMESLQQIAYKSVRIYTLLQVAIMPLCLVLNYLNHAYCSNPIEFNAKFLYDKVAIAAIGIVLLSVIAKYKSPTAMYIMLLITSLSFFEIYNATRPKYISYIIFVLYFSYSKSVGIFSGLKLPVVLSIHVFMYLYHIIRLLIQHKQDPSFPICFAFMILANFIVVDMPHIFCLQTYSHKSQAQEASINDFRMVLNALPYPVIILREGVIALKNYVASSMYTDDDVMQLINTSNVLNSQNSKLTQFNNKLLSVKIISLPTFTFGSNSSVISIVDDTDIIECEKKAASENAKWLFINSTNHQIRTPLSGIESSLLMLEKIIQDGDIHSIMKYINICLISVLNLRHTVNDGILLYEDIDNSTIVHNDCFEIEEITNEVNRIFLFEKYDKNVVLNIHSPIIPYQIISDKKLILHILYTVLMNAIKYTPSGEITFSVRLNSDSECSQPQLLLAFSDTGVGMSIEEQGRLFQTFTDSLLKKQQHQTSNGVGLYIVKKVCNLLQGDITFQSKQGEGTTFNIRIAVNVTPKVTKIANENKTTDSIKSDRLLVVDDNTANVFILSAMLAKLSIKCDEAYNGIEAVKKYCNYPYSLIFMDINMPEMNGYEASKVITQKANEMHRSVIIIAVSAQDEPKKQGYATAGISEWVEKPLRFDKLTNLLNKYNIKI